jgi:hypothetical protein
VNFVISLDVPNLLTLANGRLYYPFYLARFIYDNELNLRLVEFIGYYFRISPVMMLYPALSIKLIMILLIIITSYYYINRRNYQFLIEFLISILYVYYLRQ